MCYYMDIDYSIDVVKDIEYRQGCKTCACARGSAESCRFSSGSTVKIRMAAAVPRSPGEVKNTGMNSILADTHFQITSMIKMA